MPTLNSFKNSGIFQEKNNVSVFYFSSMASTSSSSGSVVYTYKKLVVPVSMRSIYWKYFGFPASETGEIITKLKIICILCKSQIAYNKNTSNLRYVNILLVCENGVEVMQFIVNSNYGPCIY